MPADKPTEATCTTSLKLLGDYWTLRIVDALRSGELHFCELQRTVDNLNPVTLTDRLKKLESSQLIYRTAASKADVSYGLAPLGHEILPVLAAIDTFSQRLRATQVAA